MRIAIMLSTGEQVWYHGSDTNGITQFDDAKLEHEKFGHFFTDSEDMARNFGKHVYTCTLKFKKPYVISAAKWDALRDEMQRSESRYQDYKALLMQNGYDSLLVKGEVVRFGKWDINNPSIVAVFDTKSITHIKQKE